MSRALRRACNFKFYFSLLRFKKLIYLSLDNNFLKAYDNI
ncbi:hypothetical protein HMPREF9225_1965 [Peptoniphilus duerdenii ATCC BAA-1640]|uniref:Uncharacterized protein n=1 Tax=Peptoniphilus duerdenii ATCC BAA-1640 TaxID=862517 RepID=E0NP76_9FIRM|nr:hypothetical protein HMPREF9225_1965 [Peptoniphilus duerdenii ATCC BAA-1640]